MNWQEFVDAAPEIGAWAGERIGKPGLAMLATVRRDGSPRVSPCEVKVFEGELTLGMMWRSTKALDLVRDQRCVVHSIVTDKAGTEGEVKLRGRVADVTDPGFRARYARALLEETGWQPQEPYHLFALNIQDATYVKYEPANGDQSLVRWQAGEPERKRLRRFNGSGLED